MAYAPYRGRIYQGHPEDREDLAGHEYFTYEDLVDEIADIPATPVFDEPIAPILPDPSPDVGGAVGDARMSYRDYSDPYSAALPGLGDLGLNPNTAVALLAPGALSGPFLKALTGATHGVYGGGPLGMGGLLGKLPGRDWDYSQRVREAYEDVRDLAARGISSVAPSAGPVSGTRSPSAVDPSTGLAGHPGVAPGSTGAHAAAVNAAANAAAAERASRPGMSSFHGGGYVHPHLLDDNANGNANVLPGEYIVNQRATEKHRPLLDQLNQGNMPAALPPPGNSREWWEDI